MPVHYGLESGISEAIRNAQVIFVDDWMVR
jgi:hypothetical protein